MAQNNNDQLPGIIIPAYNPSVQLVGLVDELLKDHYPFLIVVNDGSKPDCLPIFEQLKNKPRVQVLKHVVNRGKGEALKTAFNAALDLFPKASGVVTADADGQHLPKDILKVAQAFAANPKALWLGVRKFDGEVPLRSKFGNTLTNFIMSLFIGQNLGDTQTGLRAISLSFLEVLVNLRTNGYDYELDMLLQAHDQKITIKREFITTVYENNNESSHFNPFWDSLKIYFVFFRFLFSSLLSVLIDTGVFALVYQFSQSTTQSLIVARIFSSLFNFLMVKNYVFKSKGNVAWELFKYAILVVVFGTLAIHLIDFMKTKTDMNIVAIKLMVEGAIFVASFSIQRVLIFLPKRLVKLKNA